MGIFGPLIVQETSDVLQGTFIYADEEGYHLSDEFRGSELLN